MSIYFLRTSEGDYRLDATSNMTRVISGKSSDNLIESGKTTSDNYVNRPDRFRLTGVISDIKTTTSSSRTPDSFIRGITKVKEAGEVVTLYIGTAIAKADKCVIEGFEISQDRVNGHLRGTDSFKVKLNIKKLRFSEQILITQERNPKFSDDYQETQEGAGSTVEAPTEITSAEREARGYAKLKEADLIL